VRDGGAGVAAMAASAWWSALPVVGVSGIVCGLIAALAWLELRFGAELPAWWRVPRRALFGVIAGTALLSLLPFIAAAAHAGGFVGGGAVAIALAWRGFGARRSAAGSAASPARARRRARSRSARRATSWRARASSPRAT
jgi:hypothetical protein